MSTIKILPVCFPLHENRDFLAESEWVIFKLLCRPVASFAETDAETLSADTGGQVSKERCDELIRIVHINALDGLGSWIARLLAQAGLSRIDMLNLTADEITDRVNTKLGYKLCNQATAEALAELQAQWNNHSQTQSNG